MKHKGHEYEINFCSPKEYTGEGKGLFRICMAMPTSGEYYKTYEDAETKAISIIDKLGMVGILAVELFLTKDGQLLVNEIAPRPHNSGHHTIECNVTSQFEQHMRSVLNLPLGDTRIIQPGVMINLLGEKGYQGSVIYQGLETAIAIPGVKPHIYGKAETKSFRKMGHITIVAPTLEEAKTNGRKVKELVKVIS